MSSDNYYQLYETPDNRFIVTMGFGSDDGQPHPRATDPVFDYEFDAKQWAERQPSEYGVYPIQKLSERMWRHYLVRCGIIKVGESA